MAILSFKYESLQRAAAVLSQEKQQLVAFVESTEFSTEQCYFLDDQLADKLSAHLKTCLPDCHLPSLFVFSSQLPLLISGKIDRKALPKSTNVLPQSCLPVKERVTTSNKIDLYEGDNVGPVTYQQQGIWLSDNITDISTSNSVESAYICLEKVNTEALQCSVNYVIAKHASLRTFFLLKDGQLLQRVINLECDKFKQLLVSSFSICSSNLEWNGKKVILPQIKYDLVDGPGPCFGLLYSIMCGLIIPKGLCLPFKYTIS